MPYRNLTKRKAYHRKYDNKHNQTPRSRYGRLRCKAKERKISLKLSFEEYCEIVVGKRCFYCDNSLPKTGYGIDRSNNAVGYTPRNCVPCCRSCNTRKSYLEMAGVTHPRIVAILREILQGPNGRPIC